MITVEEVQSIPAEVLKLKKVLSDEETHKMEGQHLDSVSLIDSTRNLDVYGEDGILLKVRRNIIPPKVWKSAYANLEKSATVSDNRGSAGGPISDEDAMTLACSVGGVDFLRVSPFKIKAVFPDGSISKVSRSIPTQGGIVGFFEDTPRQPFCRLTSYTQNNFQKIH